MDGEEIEDFVSLTQPVEYQLVHSWRIANFERYFCSEYHLSSIHSHVFYHDEDPTTKWSLQFFPKGDKDANSQNTGGPEMVSFFINLDKSSETVELLAKYSAVILIKESNEDGKEKAVQKVTGSNTFKRGSGWGRSKFMKLEDLLKDRSLYLPDDRLTLRVKIKYIKHITEMEKRRKDSVSSRTTILTTNSSPSSSESTVSEVTEAVISKKRPNTDPCHSGSARSAIDWCDVTFSVSGTHIHAHKLIILSACPALAEMLQQTNESLVYVEGTDPAAFAEMIRFIYTEDCDLPNFSYKLLAMARRFRLPALQLKCEDYLLKVIDKTNCYMLYSLADLCSSNRLKAAAKIMISNLGIIPDSSSLPNAGTIE